MGRQHRPFGLSISSEIFVILDDLLCKNLVLHVDEMVVASNIFEDRIKHLDFLFKRLFEILRKPHFTNLKLISSAT